MAILVGSATETRFRDTASKLGYTSEDELLQHLLSLEEAAQQELDEAIRGNEERLRTAINDGLAQLERGEFVTAEESRARIAALREREMKRTSEAA